MASSRFRISRDRLAQVSLLRTFFATRTGISTSGGKRRFGPDCDLKTSTFISIFFLASENHPFQLFYAGFMRGVNEFCGEKQGRVIHWPCSPFPGKA
jgi:hypothetical protein